MGICDHCKLKNPCRDCKEITKRFLNKLEADAKEQAIRLSKMKNVAEYSVLDNSARKQYGRSRSELRIEELLYREYAKAERELEISDLFRRPLTPRSSKSLPVIDKDKKHLRLENDQPLINGPPSDSKITEQNNEQRTFDNLGKSTYSPTTKQDHFKTLRMSKQVASALHPSKASLDIDSIITDDKILLERRHILQIPKGMHKDDDILPEHPRSYTHDREKYVKKNIADQYLATAEKFFSKDTQKSWQIPSDEDIEMDKKRVKNLDDMKQQKYEMETTQREFSFSFYQENPEPKTELKLQKTSLEMIKETQEALQDKSVESKRKVIENRLRKEEKQEKNRLLQEEKDRINAGEKAQVQRTKIILEEVKLMKKIELSHIKEAQNWDLTLPKKSSLEVKLAAAIKKNMLGAQLLLKPTGLKSVANREKPVAQIQLKKNIPGETKREAISGKSSKLSTPRGPKEFKDIMKSDDKELHVDWDDKELHEMQNKMLVESERKSPKQLDSKIPNKFEKNINKYAKQAENEKETDMESKKLKDLEAITPKFLENEKAYTHPSARKRPLLDEGLPLNREKAYDLSKNKYDTKNEQKKMLTKDTKDVEKNIIIESDKVKNVEKNIIKESDKVKDIKSKAISKFNLNISNENKGAQTLKEKHDFGLADMIKQKKTIKAKDTKELARMQKEDKSKTPTNTMTTAKLTDYKLTKKQDNTNIEKYKFKIPQTEIIMKFKEDPVGEKYTYKGKTLRDHWDLHETCHKDTKDPLCIFCLHSEKELNTDLRRQKKNSDECIRGKNIVNANASTDKDDHIKIPMIFHTKYDVPIYVIGNTEKKEIMSDGKPKTADKGLNTANSAVIQYNLSDRTFIEKGWTVLPTEKVMRKMNVYRMRPAKPEFDWFKRNKDQQKIFYDSGERFSEYQEDGRCRWYYKNERLALDYYDAAETNAQQRIVIYSNGEPDERGRGRPYTILATFDYLGNGVVFDHGGKIRLKYNQTEGVILDRNIGPVSHWKWHTLNDPPDLQQVMIDTQLAHKDPKILKMGEKEAVASRHHRSSDNEEMIAIEFDNFVKGKSRKLNQTFKPFQIRMKALKINEHFSLKILDQANIYLIYRDGTTNIKLNLGMLLDHKEIIDTDTAEVGEVANSLERLPARTDSLAAIQKSVAYAQHLEKTQTERERRLRPLEPSASADKLVAAASRPMRFPLGAYNPSITTTTQSTKSYRKPPSIVYYSTV